MRILVPATLGIASWCVILGLWNHDWHLIVGGLAVLVVLPYVTTDVVSDEDELDRLWDDSE